MAHGVTPTVYSTPNAATGDWWPRGCRSLPPWRILDRQEATVEEREDYEAAYSHADWSVWAGVDYEAIVAEAQQGASVIIWDGGNNDFSFLKIRSRDCGG